MSKIWLLSAIIVTLTFGCAKNNTQKEVVLAEPPNPLQNLVGTYRGEAHHHDERTVSGGPGGFYTVTKDTTYYSFQLDVTGATDSCLFIYFPFLVYDTLCLKTDMLFNVSDTKFWRSPYGKSSRSEYFHLYFRNDSLIGDILYERGPMPHSGSYKLKFQKI